MATRMGLNASAWDGQGKPDARPHQQIGVIDGSWRGAEPKIPPLLHNCVTPLTVRIEPISCIDTPSPLPQQLGMPTVISLEGLENGENGVWFIKLWSASTTGWVQSMAAAARVSAHPTPHVALDILIGRGRRRSSALSPLQCLHQTFIGARLTFACHLSICSRALIDSARPLICWLP